MPASIEKVSSGGSATTNKNATTNNTNTKTEVKTETVNLTDASNPDFYVDDFTEYYVRKKGYMVGDDTGFNPNGDMTRAQMVQILYAMEGKPSGAKANFSDVKSGEWYADSVAWAQSNGIVAGHTDGTFRPNDKITNEQMAAIMKKYAEFKGQDTSIKGDEVWAIDKLDRSNYSRDALAWANENHMFKVDSILDLKPKDTAKREDIALMLKQYDRFYNSSSYKENLDNYRTLSKKINTPKMEDILNSTATRYSTFSDLFNSDKYGGNQADPYNYVNEYNTLDELLSDNSINGQKAQAIYNITKKYFDDDITLGDLKLLTYTYNANGCAYMGVADAFALQVSNLSNGEEVFKKTMGYDLYATNGTTKSCNIDTVAYEIFLHQATTSIDNPTPRSVANSDTLTLAMKQNGESAREFFEKKGIDFNYNWGSVMAENTEDSYRQMMAEVYEKRSDLGDGVYILNGTNFDMRRFNKSTYNNTDLLSDKALTNSVSTNNTYSNVDGHAMMVSGICEEGFIVSSWGEKFLIPFDETFNNLQKDSASNQKPNMELIGYTFGFNNVGGNK